MEHDEIGVLFARRDSREVSEAPVFYNHPSRATCPPGAFLDVVELWKTSDRNIT